MLLSFSIEMFLTNYDVIKQKYFFTYSIVWNWTKWERNILMETTKFKE